MFITKNNIFFFIGTEAELIKIFPIMLECEHREINYSIIASGQNDIIHSRILKDTSIKDVELELSKDTYITTGIQLIFWWMRCFCGAKKKIKEVFTDVEFKRSVMIVHGDTVSTFLGALVGRMLGMVVCHVEAGLRSHHLFDPFPEEIDRILTSKCARIHFAPGDVPEKNLCRAKGAVINTQYNTLSDSLKIAATMHIDDKSLESIFDHDYFVFVMHRQENLMNESFVTSVVEKIVAIAKEKKCVIILHKITKNTFEKYGLMDKLIKNANIKMLPRVNYFDFMKLLKNSNFVISDGGSNQEELYYMGKPCLIMRKSTERSEGIGINCIMFNGDIDAIDRFVASYQELSRGEPHMEASPSKIIVDYLEKNFFGNK